jgi:hypothetical protein
MSETVRRMKANKKYEGTVCGWCNNALQLGEDIVVCQACERAHHASCWDEHDGCSNKSCVNAPFKKVEDVAAKEAEAQKPLAPYEMICPHCKSRIRAGSERCPVCHRFTSPDGLYHGPTELCSKARNALIAGIVGLFLFGFILGIVAITQARSAKEMIRSDYRLHGMGVATAAEVVGWIALVGWVIAICTRVSGG